MLGVIRELQPAAISSVFFRSVLVQPPKLKAAIHYRTFGRLAGRNCSTVPNWAQWRPPRARAWNSFGNRLPIRSPRQARESGLCFGFENED
jgi:hypothetical protein